MENKLTRFIDALLKHLAELSDDEGYLYDPGWQEALACVGQFVDAYENGEDWSS